MNKLTALTLCLILYSGCAVAQAKNRPASAVSNLRAELLPCGEKIQRLCDKLSDEDCEKKLPSEAWLECATAWEKIANSSTRTPEAPYVAIEMLIEAGLRSDSFTRQLAILRRAIDLAEKFQNLLGSRAIKETRRVLNK